MNNWPNLKYWVLKRSPNGKSSRENYQEKKKYIKSSTRENGDIAQLVRKEKDENGMFIINFMQ